MQAIPDTAKDWCVWAWTEHQEGRLDRARAGLERALAIDPASLAARFGLASVLLDTGDVAAATVIAVDMASTAPGNPDTLWLQARLATARGDAQQARESLVGLLGHSGLNEAQRAEALLMLGLAQGDLGNSAEAFAAALQGKRLQRDFHAPEAKGQEDEVSKLRRLATWIRSTPTEWPPAPQRAAPNAAPSHIFLLGFPRSGTTLLEQVLAAHSRVSTLEEAPTLAAAYQAFLSDADACAALMRLEPEEAAAWAVHYWAGIRERTEVAGRVFVDKQPAGTLYLPIIARLFPQARIIFAVRDPRDVVLSCFRQAFTMNAMTYAFTDLVETAACYDACMSLAEQARGRLPLAWLDVRHEALVENFDDELGSILEFLGLAPDPAMADFAASARSRTIRTPSATQVRAGLNRRGLGRWEHFRRELAPVLPVLAPWVGRFGYPT